MPPLTIPSLHSCRDWPRHRVGPVQSHAFQGSWQSDYDMASYSDDGRTLTLQIPTMHGGSVTLSTRLNS